MSLCSTDLEFVIIVGDHKRPVPQMTSLAVPPISDRVSGKTFH